MATATVLNVHGTTNRAAVGHKTTNKMRVRPDTAVGGPHPDHHGGTPDPTV